MMYLRRHSPLLLTTCFLLAMLGCGGSGSTTTADSVSIALTPSFAYLIAGGATGTATASVARSAGNTNAILLAVTGVPAGITATITQPGSASFGTVALTAASTIAPGTYTLNVQVTDGTANSSAPLSITVSTDVLTLSASSPSIVVRQDGTAAAFPITLVRTLGDYSTVSVTASGLPTGLTASFTQPGATDSCTVTFATSTTTPAAAGTYTVTLTANDGQVTATTTVSVTVDTVVTVNNAIDTTIGLAGHLQEFMSTGFQPSIFNNAYFTSFPSTTSLAALAPKHIRLQPKTGDIPQVANSTPQAASDWSFTAVDQTVQPVLTVGDNSPTFQIAVAPSFLNDSSGHFIYNSTNLALLATYAQNLVRYYNTGGFTWGGQHFQSPSSTHITWWAIFNEPNLNNVTAAQYVSIYNMLVPAMLSVDPTLKFVALELSDFSGQPQAYLPTLVQPAASGGLNAQVNAFATHFYGTCVQATPDASLFSGVGQFVTDINYFHTELATRSDLAAVPVWVTENNVDSDYELTTGYDSCTPTQLYVLDPRGTSGFFTAYRPLVFSRLGKAGNESLFHFLYEGSAAYGEVNSGSNAKTLAYWTDYELEHVFPWDGVSTGASLYKTTTSETTPTVDAIATLNADNSVSLMVTNYATAATTDDNGAGVARTVYVNLTTLGPFSSVTETDLNASTPLTTGPVATPITPSTTLTVNFTGYGASLFVLKP